MKLAILGIMSFLSVTPSIAGTICVLDSYSRDDADWEFEKPDVLAEGKSLTFLDSKTVRVYFHRGEYWDEYSLDYACKGMGNGEIKICFNGKREARDEFAIQKSGRNYKVYQLITRDRQKFLNPRITGIFKCE